MKVVVDASVIIKWFIPEVHAIFANRVLQKNWSLLVPDLTFSEVGNILWKKCRRKELTINIATEILNDFKKMPLCVHSSEDLLSTAWQIATQYQCTLYDSMYLALAQTEGCLFITADQTLCNILQKTPLASLLLWIENV